MSEPIIHIEQVHKYFGRLHALRGVDLDVKKGEVVVILGPSGSGKSTLLRCINHLEVYNSGSITVDGIHLKSTRDINAVRREVGMVFQSFNLFGHLTVMKNLTLAQKTVRKRNEKEAGDIALKLLDKVGIADKADAYPGTAFGRPAAACRYRQSTRDEP
jgi:polar amino acid transport system ATP-binding protein